MDNDMQAAVTPAPPPAFGRLDPTSFPHPARSGGSIPSTIDNVEHLLAGIRVSARFNVMKKRLELRGDDGRMVSINRIASAAMLNNLGTGWLTSFVDEIGCRNPHNPVRDWILDTPWDGADRLTAFYATVLEADDYPADLKEALLHRWLLAAVAAAIKDGRVPVHGVLTLQGDQGIGKTSWIGRLMPEPLRADYIKLDHQLDPTNKDSIMGCITHFIVELGELESSFRKDIQRIKGFLTNDCDKLRRPYAREEAEYPRKTVFAASVNDARFLPDPSGSRRWWTIAVKGLNYTHDVDMQQLYAQLAVELDHGEQHWLTPMEARQLAQYNLRHRSVSAIAERVQEHLDCDRLDREGGVPKTAVEILREIGIANPTNPQCKECGEALRELLGPPRRINGRDRWRVHVRGVVSPTVGRKAPPEDEVY